MAKEQQIRIKLKAYDNYVVDESARKIAETVIKTQAKVKGPIPYLQKFIDIVSSDHLMLIKNQENTLK